MSTDWQVASSTRAKKPKSSSRKESAKESKKEEKFAAIHAGAFSNPLWDRPPEPEVTEADEGEDGEAFTTSQTLFSRFADLEDRKEKAARRRAGAGPESGGEDFQATAALNGTAVKPPKKEKPVKKEQPKPKKKSVADVGSQLDTPKLQAYIADSDEQYVTADPHIPLLRLADFFEKEFSTANLNWDKVLVEKPLAERISIPAGEVRNEAITVAVTWLAGKKKEPVQKFLTLLVEQVFGPLVDPEKKPKTAAPGAGIGVKIVLQTLARAHPYVLKDSLPSIKEFCSRKSKLLAPTLPTFVWLAGQLIQTAPALAFAAWADHLLPILNDHALPIPTRESILSFVDLIFVKEGLAALRADLKANCSDGVLSVASVESLMTKALSSQGPSSTVSLLPAVAERISTVYSLVREYLFFPPISNFFPRNYFSLLLKLSNSADPAISSEAIDLLTTYVVRNKKASSLWGDLYLNNLQASLRIIECLLSSWSEHKDKAIGNTPLLERVRALLKLNLDIAAQNYKLPKVKGKEAAKVNAADIDACTDALKELESKLVNNTSSGGSTSLWKFIIPLLILLVLLLQWQAPKALPSLLSGTGS
mmetsp:Transcript_38819/g.62873  ORF Transcript_38819/g.62873 Transcript_38819/m.62873 type:complete len:591 (-) Transcript_38819:373-2145(-)